MNCRDFINEFEERRNLSEAAQFHQNDCPGCQKASRTQTQIWDAIDNLAKINAPNNFEFGVKARIAKTEPNVLRPQFLPVLRYVLPLSVIVLVVGVLAFNTAFFFGSNNAPQLALTAVPQQEIKTTVPLNNFLPAAPALMQNTNTLPVYPNEAFVVNPTNQSAKPLTSKPETQFASLKTTKKLTNNFPKVSVKENNDRNGGGSIDTAVTQPKVLTPEGFDISTPIENPIKNANSSQTIVSSIWSLIGIEIASENGKQVVKSVKQNSAAARSNIKVGDVIEAVDGVKTSSVSTNDGKIEVKTLTVLRGTEKLEISLNN